MEEVPARIPLTQEQWAALDPAVKAVSQTLLARIRHLEARVNQNSSSSSKPPYSDPPWARPVKRKKPRSGRKRGGQPGHPPHLRELLPPEKVDVGSDCLPACCAHCSNAFQEGIDVELDPERHQVVDIPIVKPFVTEYVLHIR